MHTPSAPVTTTVPLTAAALRAATGPGLQFGGVTERVLGQASRRQYR